MSNEMYELLKKILSARAEHYKDNNPDRSSAYLSALYMLECAHENNYECLSQFDYL